MRDSSGSKPAADELDGERLGVAPAGVVSPGPELLGEAIHLLRGVAQGLGHLPRRRAVSVGDDVGGHGGTVRSIAFVDVLDHFLPLIPGGQIEIDVGPFTPLLGQEALEQQLHLHRVDGGDRQGIADGAVGGRAPPLSEDSLPFAELHDVPDDEEVASQIEPVDHGQLLFDLVLAAAGEWTKATPGTVPGDVPQVGHGGLARWHRVVGKAIAEIGQGEVELLSQLVAADEGLWMIGE